MAKRKKLSKRVQEVAKRRKPEWQKIPVPKRLFNLFKKVRDGKFEDEELYAKYRVEADKYLGEFATDKIESGRLTVCLTRMAMGTLNLDYSNRD